MRWFDQKVMACREPEEAAAADEVAEQVAAACSKALVGARTLNEEWAEKLRHKREVGEAKWASVASIAAESAQFFDKPDRFDSATTAAHRADESASRMAPSSAVSDVAIVMEQETGGGEVDSVSNMAADFVGGIIFPLLAKLACWMAVCL